MVIGRNRGIALLRGGLGWYECVPGSNISGDRSRSLGSWGMSFSRTDGVIVALKVDFNATWNVSESCRCGIGHMCDRSYMGSVAQTYKVVPISRSE